MNETPETPVPFATVGEMARWTSSNPEDNGATQEWWQYAAAYVEALEADRDALRERLKETEKDIIYLAGEVSEGSEMVAEAAVMWAKYSASLSPEERTP